MLMRALGVAVRLLGTIIGLPGVSTVLAVTVEEMHQRAGCE